MFQHPAVPIGVVVVMIPAFSSHQGDHPNEKDTIVFCANDLDRIDGACRHPTARQTQEAGEEHRYIAFDPHRS
jgi:hypothetical protein